MGGCSSNLNRGPHSSSSSSSSKGGKRCGNKPSNPMVRVIGWDGKMKEFEPPICGAQIVSENPDSILCSSEYMLVDLCPDAVPEPEELNPDHLYFLIHKSKARKPLSLEDLCELAIKASSNINLSLSPNYY